jgi:hypothetical protein
LLASQTLYIYVGYGGSNSRNATFNGNLLPAPDSSNSRPGGGGVDFRLKSNNNLDYPDG